jgi:hypothetical protein
MPCSRMHLPRARAPLMADHQSRHLRPAVQALQCGFRYWGGWRTDCPRAGRQRVDDEHVRGRRIALGAIVHRCGPRRLRSCCSALASHAGCRRSPRRDPVGGIFTRPADGHLHKHCGHGRDESSQEPADQSQTDCCRARRRKNNAKLASMEIAPAMRRRDRHDQRVAVLDVRELVGHHALRPPRSSAIAEGRSWRRRRHSRGCARSRTRWAADCP